MNEVVRLYQYKGLLSGRRAAPAKELMQHLEISPATLKRDIAKLRDQLQLPVNFDRDRGGYVSEQGHTDSELPAIWFSPQVGVRRHPATDRPARPRHARRQVAMWMSWMAKLSEHFRGGQRSRGSARRLAFNKT